MRNIEGGEREGERERGGASLRQRVKPIVYTRETQTSVLIPSICAFANFPLASRARLFASRTKCNFTRVLVMSAKFTSAAGMKECQGETKGGKVSRTGQGKERTGLGRETRRRRRRTREGCDMEEEVCERERKREEKRGGGERER